MSFLSQGKAAEGPRGAYIITLCLVIISTLISGIVVNELAGRYLGFSLGGYPTVQNSTAVLAVQLSPFLIGFMVMLLSVKFIQKQRIRTAFTSRARYDWSRFFFSFGCWAVFLVLLLIVGSLLGMPIEFQFDLQTFFPLLLVSVLLIPIQTTAEDLLFRGILFQGLGQSLKNGLLAVVILGGVFGWLHSGNPEVQILGKGILFYYIFSGIFLGLITHFDDGLELSMGYHVANNLFGALILTNDWQAFQTNALFIDHSVPEIGWDLLLTLIVIQPLLLFIFSKVYRWENLRDKLF
jgi:membrane protease YdiL (CAAX protease family)